MIYLDYAASFPPYSETIAECAAVAANAYANPAAIHRAGSEARIILQRSRRTIASLLQVRPEEIFFTSGATESNNWAVAAGCLHPRRRHIVCSAIEHKSVLESVAAMERKGYQVTYLRPDRLGRIDPAEAAGAIRPDTALVCVQAVNNETGVIQAVAALAAAAHKKGALYLCDGVQSFGHVAQPLHLADLISLSAHKFGGPRGAGCLVIRQPARLSPLLFGGGQEFGLRSGTENLPAIAGFAKAAEISNTNLDEECKRLAALTGELTSGLRRLCPDLLIAGEGADRSPGVLCCAFPGKTGEEMTIRLDLKGICVSPGAACSSRDHSPSHVLLAMGYSAVEAVRFLRISLGWQTTPEEIRQTIETISHII